MVADWFVYLLRCQDQSLYCGITTDLEKRLSAHRDGKGARYTRAHGVIAIVFVEGPYSRGDALRRERAVKKLDKKSKERLVSEWKPHSRPIL